MDDVVVRGDQHGKVAACLLQGGELFVLVDTLARSRQLAANSCRCVWDGGRQVWRAEDTLGRFNSVQPIHVMILMMFSIARTTWQLLISLVIVIIIVVI